MTKIVNKKKMLHLVNRVFKLFNVELVRRSKSRPEMLFALQRTAAHGFGVRSVVDIGAAAGKWSAIALPIFPQARFLGVEPLRERICELERLKARVPRFDYALCVAGEEDGGTAYLNVAKDLGGSTVGGHGGEMRAVPIRSLDALVEAKGLEGPILVNFDTHGYEMPILRGGIKTLAQTAVIVMEVYNFQFVSQALRFHQMVAHLEEMGFRPFDLANPTYREHDHAFWQMDLFFARSDHPMFLKDSYR